MKKVISFSLYGDNDFYCLGVLDNIVKSKSIYPNWIVRVYVDTDTVPMNVIDKISELGAEVVLKSNNKNSLGMMWRFEVMFDETVDVFIVRDADSIVSLREVYVVDDWLSSGKGFSVIRDHPRHNATILGGMWGGRVAISNAGHVYARNHHTFDNRAVTLLGIIQECV